MTCVADSAIFGDEGSDCQGELIVQTTRLLGLTELYGRYYRLIDQDYLGL